MKNIKMVVFDMDGTLADTYAQPDWESDLRNECPSPYLNAKPLVDMNELGALLYLCAYAGIEVRVVTWLSKDSSEKFKKETRLAKIEWLKRHSIHPDHFHGVQYGTRKDRVVKNHLPDGAQALIFDDDPAVRNHWGLGYASDPTQEDIIEVLRSLFV